MVTEQQILDALKSVKDPDKGEDIVSLKMVSGMAIKNGHVAFAIEVEPERGPKLEGLRKQAETVVHGLSGVLTASVVLTAEKPQHGGPIHAQAQTAEPGRLLQSVKHVIAVSSGKGGVGKSTTAVNLALALSGMGLKTGLFDADIFGPSVPRLLGLAGAEPESPDGKSLAPMEAYGIKVMSIGFLVPEDAPIIWRGPMVMGALEQLMRDVNWGDLDVLVLDMPPGTGDVQLTIAQRVALAGAVIVSTPQDIALLDARKGLNMFRKVEIPVLGIVENMSTYVCPKCGHEEHIFGHGGARQEAENLNCDFLGEVPLDIAIRQTSDSGEPIVVSKPSSPHAKAYRDIAEKVKAKLDARPAMKAPKIVMQ